MTRYWIKFQGEIQDLPIGTILGIGVTAYDYSDAINLIANKIFRGKPLPKIVESIENVDIRNLHSDVAINMGIPVHRGVWFPLGYNIQ